MAGLPDLFFASASARNSKLNPDFRLTPPWQVIHFLLKIGLTCELKSTADRCELNTRKIITATIGVITKSTFLERKKFMQQLLAFKVTIIRIFETTLALVIYYSKIPSVTFAPFSSLSVKS